MTKILKYINIAMLCLAAVAAVLFYSNIVKQTGAGTDMLLFFAYISMAIIVIGVAVFYIYDLIKNPKRLKFVALLLVAAAVITLLCYYISTPTAVGLDLELESKTSGAAMRWSEAGIYGMYILFAGALISILAGSVRNMVK